MADFHSSPPLFLNNCRLAWADIFTPDKDNQKFKAVGLFDPESPNKKIAQDAMIVAAKGLWGDNAINVIRSMPGNSKALRNGNDKLDTNGAIRPDYAGLLFVSASNKAKPQVIAPRKFNGEFVIIGPDGRGYVKGLDVTKELGYELIVPYRGCYVNMKIEMVAGKSFETTKDGKKEQVPNQIFGRLLAIQFKGDGKAFGPGQTSAEGFEEEEVSESAPASSIDENDLF